MSGLGQKTRKVNTYGKKKTQIIAVHSDFTPVKPSSSPITISDDSPSPSRPAQPHKAPLKANYRPPLASKPLQDIATSRINLPTEKPISSKGVKGLSSSDKLGDVVKPDIKVRKITRPRKDTTKKVAPVYTPIKARQTLDCVEIPLASRTQPKSTFRAVTPSEIIDLTAELSSLDVIDAAPDTPVRAPLRTTPSASCITTVHPLDNLLSACTSKNILPFADFLSSKPFLDLIPSRAQASVTKIGEASYSEVYSVKRGKKEVVVIKVVPLFPACSDNSSDVPDCSEAADVLRELEITKTLSGLEGGGFVDYKGSFVVQGVYPDTLLEEWDAYEERTKTESTRPDGFGEQQTYALIVLSDGGDDLESFKFDKSLGWVQANGVFWQIVRALASAEEAFSFEHRDLHEGQILITPCAITSLDGDASDPESIGVNATIIDFGLSRLNAEDARVIWSEIPEEVYDGVGDQWDVYRAVRDVVDGDWDNYHPITNVMWLRYILRYLIHSKDLRKPRPTKLDNRAVPPSPVRTRRVPLTRRKEDDKADTRRCIEAHDGMKIVDKALSEALGKKKGVRGFRSAGDVLYFGREMGWVA